MISGESPIPYNLQAEESILGAALLSPEALAITIRMLEPEDYYRPAHRAIHTALKALWKRGERSTDPVLVADELKSQGSLEEIGGSATLLRLLAGTPATSNAEKYARIIQERALARRMYEAGLFIQDLATNADREGVDLALSTARDAVNNLDLPMGQAAPSLNVEDFLGVEEEQDWLVEGLFERGDRMILTAGEGAGKSTFFRQLGVQFAAGLHPWENRLIDPIKVLIIDVENSVPQIQRAIRPLVLKARYELRENEFDPDNLRVEVRTEGLDLTTRHDARWLMEKVGSARPDMITIGPIYKLHNENPNDEQPARKVAAVLDEVRYRYGCTLLIEAHSPHGSGSKRPLRPFGASMWLRWPEFGYGLRARKVNPLQMTMEEWRGSRDQRSWPEVVEKGRGWPFTALPQQQRAF